MPTPFVVGRRKSDRACRPSQIRCSSRDTKVQAASGRREYEMIVDAQSKFGDEMLGNSRQPPWRISRLAWIMLPCIT